MTIPTAGSVSDFEWRRQTKQALDPFFAGRLPSIGYQASGSVTQATSKSTAVTLNNANGNITMHAASLVAGTIVTFVLNNSLLGASDQIICTHHSGGTFAAYTINGRVTGTGAASIAVRNNTAGDLAEAIVIKFSVIKGA
jgi:hypothetical protein